MSQTEKSGRTLIAGCPLAVGLPLVAGAQQFEAAAAETPAASRPLRLIQMRRIAEQISAYTEEVSRGKRNLRFLSRPLYRYDESNHNADGGSSSRDAVYFSRHGVETISSEFETATPGD